MEIRMHQTASGGLGSIKEKTGRLQPEKLKRPVPIPPACLTVSGAFNIESVLGMPVNIMLMAQPSYSRDCNQLYTFAYDLVRLLKLTNFL
jgi:hypothetical protein